MRRIRTYLLCALAGLLQMACTQAPDVPGYSHYSYITSPEVPQIIAKFLPDSLTNPTPGPTPP